MVHYSKRNSLCQSLLLSTLVYYSIYMFMYISFNTFHINDYVSLLSTLIHIVFSIRSYAWNNEPYTTTPPT